VVKKGNQNLEGRREKTIEPKLRGFLHVALMRHLSVAPISQRDEILKRFLAIDSDTQARAYIAEATEFIRAYKLVHPPRKPWLLGKKKVGQDRTK